MIFNLYIPDFPLGQFVGSIVYFKNVEFSHNIDRFLPNGDTEIIIDFNDAPQFIFDNCSLKEIQACNRVWASGLRTEPITIPAGNKSEMMVITFKKGMAAPFFPFPLDEISDSVVDADLIWGNDFGFLRERLLATNDVADRFRLVEQFLMSAFCSKFDINPCIKFAVDEIMTRPDAVNITRMNQKIGYSPKHFASIFRRNLGVTPKAFAKIMRFQKAVNTIDGAESIDWSSIAVDCGFYDQSHFINDFKHFSGFTPDQYSKIHLNYQNYIPVG